LLVIKYQGRNKDEPSIAEKKKANEDRNFFFFEYFGAVHLRANSLVLSYTRFFQMSSWKGLSTEEVTASRQENGTNELPPPTVETFFEKLMENFQVCLAKH